MLGQNLGGLQQELHEVGAKAHATHASLKKTNQMVLPNLPIEGDVKGAGMVRGGTPNTPTGLIKKVASNTAPNRMSWI
jgi:hypothetical protein